MRRPSTRAPLFLPRPEYRRRRLVDAARLLPVVGGFLVLLPILWAPADLQGSDTARDGIYLFVIWAILVGLAAWLAPGLAEAADDGGSDDGVAEDRNTPTSGTKENA